MLRFGFEKGRHKGGQGFSFSLKPLAFCLFLIFCLVNADTAFAGSASLAWNAPTERVDGTSVTSSDIKGYNLHYGTASGSYTQTQPITGNVTTYTITNLTDGANYYFAVSAIDTADKESGYSTEACKVIGSTTPCVTTTIGGGGGGGGGNGGGNNNNNLTTGGDNSISGGGCGFVKNDGKGQKAKGEGLSLIMLIITLTGISLARSIRNIATTREGVLVMNIRKNSLIKITAISFLLTIFWSASAYAQPNITSFSGSLTDKGTLTITGSGFGTKTTGAPLIWDNFEWGNNGDKVAAAGMGWSQANYPSDPDVTINTTQKYGQGTRSTYYVVDPPDGAQAPESEEFGFLLKSFPESEMVYVSYMTRISETAGSGSRMWKLGRIVNWSAAPSYHEPPYMGVTWWPTEWDSHYDFGGGQVEIFDSSQGGYTPNVWHRVEMWIRLSNPAGATNGEIEYWADYHRYNPQTINVTRLSSVAGEKIDTFISPHSYVNSLGGYYEIWMDDVYLDNTKARIEICNSTTWNNRTHCEVQIPSAWSDTSITATVNQGAFSNLMNAYLYVIDANGNVNTNGLPLCPSCLKPPTWQ